MLCASLRVIDITFVNVTLPSLVEQLGDGVAQWLLVVEA
jgi:hypothetical protein